MHALMRTVMLHAAGLALWLSIGLGCWLLWGPLLHGIAWVLLLLGLSFALIIGWLIRGEFTYHASQLTDIFHENGPMSLGFLSDPRHSLKTSVPCGFESVQDDLAMHDYH